MPKWLEHARALANEGSYREALKLLKRGAFGLNSSEAATSRDAQALANRIAENTDGRLEASARRIAESHARRAEDLERDEGLSDYDLRLRRIEANVTVFLLLVAHDADDGTVPFDSDSFTPVTTRITQWRSSLHPCYLAGHTPVNDLGRIHVDEPEQVRIDQLMRETVNEIVLEHAAAVDDVGALREAVPACLGYAIVNDDIRARELVSTLQRRSGTTVELPPEVAMSTAILDAMQAAGPPAAERELFKFVAGAAFHVGVGAGLQDVIDRSTPSLK